MREIMTDLTGIQTRPPKFLISQVLSQLTELSSHGLNQSDGHNPLYDNSTLALDSLKLELMCFFPLIPVLG